MTLVNAETGEVLADITAEDARDLTDKIKVTVEGAWLLIKQAYETRCWAALGYSSWDDYCTREFGASRLRLPREERQEVIASLRESGLSIRAIAATGIAAKSTIEADLAAGVPNQDTSESEQAHRRCGVDGHGWHYGDCPGSTGDSELDGLLGDLDDHMARSAAEWKAETPAAAPVVDEPKITGTDGKRYSAPVPKPKPKRGSLNDAAKNAGWEFRKATERLERIVADDRFHANRQQVASHLRGHLTYAVEVLSDLLDALDNEPQEAR